MKFHPDVITIIREQNLHLWFSVYFNVYLCYNKYINQFYDIKGDREWLLLLMLL